MKKFILAIWIILAATFYFSACKKENENKNEAPFIRFSSEALSYVHIPVNNYFIYQESSSGILDSVVVTKSIVENKFKPYGLLGFFYQGAIHYQDFSLELINYSNNIPEI
jgi:hypothetical protein